jgi:signal transduction histidine kinase
MAYRQKDRAHRVRNLIAFSSFIMLLLVILIFYQAFKEYDSSMKRGAQKAQWLTNILSDQIENTFLTVDLVLQRAAERQYLNTLFGGTLPEDMVHNFNVWVEETPQIVAITMVNEHGNIEMSVHDKDYEGWINYKASLEHSEPFVKLRDNPEIERWISPHFDPKSHFRNLILVSHRIDKLNGSFGGIIIAAVHSEYFLDFFQSVESGTKRSMGLMLSDGRNMLDGTIHPRNNTQLAAELRTTLLANKQGNTIQTLFKKVGGSLQVIAFKHFKHLPMTISVAIDEEDFLKGFWDERLKDLGFLGIFTLFGSVLSFFALAMARQIIIVEESEAAAILASQAKSDFLANMSHELRTPLNAIIGFSEMMNSGYFGPLNAKQKERMLDINLCGTHLLQLINDILEFSKGDAGKLDIIEENVMIPELLDEVVRMTNDKIRLKDIRVIKDIDDGLPELYADKRKVKQIMLNLLSNAIKFTPQNGIIRLSAHLDQLGALHLVVSDTGIGIAEDDIPKALSVFGQVHRNRNHEGTGLGLPLCRMFTELHGGTLQLTSTLGEGTTVRIIMPAARIRFPNRNEE